MQVAFLHTVDECLTSVYAHRSVCVVFLSFSRLRPKRSVTSPRLVPMLPYVPPSDAYVIIGECGFPNEQQLTGTFMDDDVIPGPVATAAHSASRPSQPPPTNSHAIPSPHRERRNQVFGGDSGGGSNGPMTATRGGPSAQLQRGRLLLLSPHIQTWRLSAANRLLMLEGKVTIVGRRRTSGRSKSAAASKNSPRIRNRHAARRRLLSTRAPPHAK